MFSESESVLFKKTPAINLRFFLTFFDKINSENRRKGMSNFI